MHVANAKNLEHADWQKGSSNVDEVNVAIVGIEVAIVQRQNLMLILAIARSPQ